MLGPPLRRSRARFVFALPSLLAPSYLRIPLHFGSPDSVWRLLLSAYAEAWRYELIEGSRVDLRIDTGGGFSWQPSKVVRTEGPEVLLVSLLN